MSDQAPETGSVETTTPVAGRVLIRAGLVCDGAEIDAAPGGVLVDEGRIVAAGSLQDIGPVDDAAMIDRPFSVVMPGLVNAHAHLDLSHVEPTPAADDFTAWIEMIREARHPDEDSIRRSVRRGIALSIAGGVAAVGDIAGAGSIAPADELRRSPLGGVSFVEVFGVGRRQGEVAAALEGLAASADATGELESVVARRVRAGLSPHAPYSCGPKVFEGAVATGRPIATHLAETLEELEFVRDGGGRFDAFLREIGVWDDTVVDGPDAMAATGRHAIDAVLESIARGADAARAAGREPGPILAAHVNYPGPGHLEKLAEAGVAVVYCPRASSYFRHPAREERPHAWRAMMDAGVSLCLGTDGRPCLDTPDRISTVDEMRFLVRRDRVAGRTVLPLALANGARALGLDPERFTLAPGPVAGLIAVPAPASVRGDRLDAALRVDTAPEWLVDPVWS